jgi:hypothetical protein
MSIGIKEIILLAPIEKPYALAEERRLITPVLALEKEWVAAVATGVGKAGG